VTVTNIPDEHHIVRHCKFKLYFEKNGQIVPYPEAFHLKHATDQFPAEEWLSGIYYEWCDGSPDEKMAACSQFISIKIKPKDALLRMNAGLIRKQGESVNRRLRVTHEPIPECSSYAAIRGLALEPETSLCQLLAQLAVVETISREAVQLI